MSDHVWSSREEWAKDRRAPYYDRYEDLAVSERLADYADKATVAELIGRLRSLWKTKGSQMRTGTDDERMYLKEDRRIINVIISVMNRGRIPHHRIGYIGKELEAMVAPIVDAYEAAHKAATEQRTREIEATPIDDAAWEAELQRRVEVDEYLGRRSA